MLPKLQPNETLRLWARCTTLDKADLAAQALQYTAKGEILTFPSNELAGVDVRSLDKLVCLLARSSRGAHELTLLVSVAPPYGVVAPSIGDPLQIRLAVCSRDLLLLQPNFARSLRESSPHVKDARIALRGRCPSRLPHVREVPEDGGGARRATFQGKMSLRFVLSRS